MKNYTENKGLCKEGSVDITRSISITYRVEKIAESGRGGGVDSVRIRRLQPMHIRPRTEAVETVGITGSIREKW